MQGLVCQLSMLTLLLPGPALLLKLALQGHTKSGWLPAWLCHAQHDNTNDNDTNNSNNNNNNNNINNSNDNNNYSSGYTNDDNTDNNNNKNEFAFQLMVS